MMSIKTLKNLRRAYRLLCFSGAVPYKCADDIDGLKLKSVISPLRVFHDRIVLCLTFFHTFFLIVRFLQAISSKSQRFFLLFVHLAWTAAFLLISCLHVSLVINRNEVKSYFNGLIKFYTSYFSMPGARLLAKERRRKQVKPSLLDFLVMAFLIGAVLNTILTLQIFLIYNESYQFVYSTLPTCWKESFPSSKFPFVLYELVMPGINWALLLFFVFIHLVHLLCTRDYLYALRENTLNGRLKLEKLLHHYRSIQLLHSHYNECIASHMPFELLMVISLTLAGNLGTMRIIHVREQVSIPEMGLVPLIPLLTGMFQLIFYQRAGQLHHLSSFYLRSSKKGLFGSDNRCAKMYLQSLSPLFVKIGTLYKVRQFTVVRFFAGIVVATARLSMVFFNKQYIYQNSIVAGN